MVSALLVSSLSSLSVTKPRSILTALLSKLDVHVSGLGCSASQNTGVMITYVPQVLESLQDTIKDALPSNIRQKELSTAVWKLGTAIEAVVKKRDWIEAAKREQEGQTWVFNKKLEHEIELQVFANYQFSPRFVNKRRHRTDHLLAEDNEQWPMLTLDDLTLYLPGKCKRHSLTIGP